MELEWFCIGFIRFCEREFALSQNLVLLMVFYSFRTARGSELPVLVAPPRPGGPARRGTRNDEMIFHGNKNVFSARAKEM